MPSGLTLTLAGAAEIEAAYQAGNVVTIQAVAIGDGGGQTPPSTPDEMAAMTALAGEFGREPFSSGTTEDGMISGQTVIDCKTYPGETIRELGLISESGTLIAYGLYPDTYLPAQTDSVIKEVIITSVLELTHAESVTLLLDPERMVLTQNAGDKRYLRISEDLAETAEKGSQAQALARQHLDVYSTTEADENFQPAGDYALAGDVYTKTESDDRFQPKGDYYTKTESDDRFQAKGDYYTKTESDDRFQPKGDYYTKTESDDRFQAKGDYYTKTESDALYVQAVQLGASVYVGKGGYAASGHLIYALDGGETMSWCYARPVQVKINGVWATIDSVD